MKNPFEPYMDKIRETKEVTETGLEKVARGIRDKGYDFHRKVHDKEGRDPKTYHTSEHLLAVERGAEQMARILHLSPHQQAVVEMAIAWHDTIIEYDEPDPGNLLATIRRHRGAREGDKPKGIDGNESRSARLLEEEMRKANELAGQEIFTEEQIRIAVWAIEATYPDTDLGPDLEGAEFANYPYYTIAIAQNPELGALLEELKKEGISKGPLFFQPHLEKPLEEGRKVPREVLIVALSDLGAAGIAEKEEFFRGGDNEMRELYANLRRPDVMHRLIGGDEDSDRVDRERVARAFFDWLDSQTGFAAWQAIRFEKILYLLKQQNDLTPEEEQGLRNQFSNFVENIRATRDRAKELRMKFEEIKSTSGEKAAFLYLVKKLHYEI